MPGVAYYEDVPQQKEIYTFKAPWTIYSLAWSDWIDPSTQLRLAIGSYIDKYCNVVRIVHKRHRSLDVPRRSNYSDIFTICEFSHPYPATKIQWSPVAAHGVNHRDLIATSGDYLRIWNLKDDGSGRGTCTAKKIALFNNNKSSELCAPITSFEWNEVDPNIIGTCSIDTTCTIWDVPTETAQTQLIAHEGEVLDIAFADRNVFATVSTDGSVRMFDLRNLDHSTIIYESANLAPLLRLEWNKLNPNFIATFAADSHTTHIVDVRRLPSQPMIELKGHNGYVNAVSWAPHSPNHICTAADDCQAYIWDVSRHVVENNDPILAYTAGGEVNNLKWCTSQPDWVSIVYRDELQILRV